MDHYKFCPQCGEGLEKEDEFCTNCGIRVDFNPIQTGERLNNSGSSEKQRKSGVMKIISFGIVVLMIISAGSVYYFTHKNKKDKPVESTSKAVNNSIVDNKSNIDSQSNTTSEVSKPKYDFQNPLTYIPEANKKYTFSADYTDGLSQTYDEIAGKISDLTVISMVTIVPESEAMCQHLVKRNEGIYIVSDSDISVASLYLPSELKVGKEWKGNGSTNKILKTNEICDMGFAKFQNCILVQQNYEEAGYSFNVWYAPGVGYIKSTYADSGKMYIEMKGTVDITETEAKTQLKKFSPNVSGIK